VFGGVKSFACNTEKKEPTSLSLKELDSIGKLGIICVKMVEGLKYFIGLKNNEILL
jgi:hypothetical protein